MAVDRVNASLLIDPFESYPDGLACRWMKVYHPGLDATEIHYDAYFPIDGTREPFTLPLGVERLTVSDRDYVVRCHRHILEESQRQARANPGMMFTERFRVGSLDLRQAVPPGAATLSPDKRRARSLELLNEWLTPEQRKSLAVHKYFAVTGSIGGRYHINYGTVNNIECIRRDGGKNQVLCAVPVDHVPIGDQLLAQKIALETDEIAVHKVANVAVANWPWAPEPYYGG